MLPEQLNGHSTAHLNGNGRHAGRPGPIVTAREIRAELARRDQLRAARDRRYREKKRAARERQLALLRVPEFPWPE